MSALSLRLQRTKALLERMQTDLHTALTELSTLEDNRTAHWRCNRCRHIKHFTRRVLHSSVPPCPQCGHEEFTPHE